MGYTYNVPNTESTSTRITDVVIQDRVQLIYPYYQ